jgi:protein TonB
MALSNLVVDKLEQYGGIDLKKNYNKYFSNALGISIAMHLLVILLFIGYTWFMNDDKRVPHLRIHSIAELAPPPSTQDKPDEAQPVTPPPPSDVVKPNLGVPVPVPDAIAPQLTLPNMNEPPPPAASNGPVSSNAPVSLDIPAQPATEADPTPDEFIDVSEEPHEVQPLEKLIVYPEIARRSGLEGKVQLQALIGKDGHVEKVEILKSDYDIFRDAAIAAMKSAKFTPARQNGTPLKLWITRTINFKLNSK